MSVPLKGFSNYVGTVASGVYQNAGGVVLDLSGNGVDLSNTAVVKVAPFDNNKNSFYALLDLSNNFVNNVDCSGANIIRVLNGSVLPVGFVNNSSLVNAFVCDTSGNLWVGGHQMEVKRNYSDNTFISKAENMFIVPRIGTVQPTVFNHVDVSGCNDICPVEDLMFASVVDVSGKCLNYGATHNVQVGSVVFPRILGNTLAFNMYFSPLSGGVALDDKDMDLSGHRLVAFSRVGNYGNDVSGFYVVRGNSDNNNGPADDELGDNPAPTTPVPGGINYDLSLNKIAYDSDRNNLYVIRNQNDKHPIVLPLDVSSGAYTSDYTVQSDALLKYAEATSSTAGAVDSSGFMVVCQNPTTEAERPIIVLDSSGMAFSGLSLLDVSGVVAMDTVVAPYGGSNYNYLFLVDASRNVVRDRDDSKNAKAKIAELWLTSRSYDYTGEYRDGSGISFIHGGNSSFNYDVSGAYIRDLRVDACGNVFLGGHQIFIQNNPTIQSANIQSTANLNVVSSASLAVATNNNPLLGNDLPYDSSVALTNEKEPSEKITSFINNRDPNCSVDKIIKSRV
jgi:hypothetical protein